ncbi:sphingosine kinase 2-like [Tachypleus tridentatus]|uniref:sphingosine kinase 2-like n=1 Tax=Tachypleus tridentatus TaxID=6853 RepID=UPI003FD178FA
MAEIGKDTEFDSETPFKCSSKNEAKEKVILEDYFSCYTKFNKVTYFVVKLTNLALVCEPLTNDSKPKIQRVSTNDIVGCSVKKTNPKSDTEQTFQIHLEIYYYPMIRRFWIKQRSRRQLSLIVDRSISWEINENRATKWKNALLWTSSKLGQPKDGLHYEQTLGRPLELLPKRHLLVAINPVSGQKKAYEIFKKRVVPLLEESEITWEVVLSGESHLTLLFEKLWSSEIG